MYYASSSSSIYLVTRINISTKLIKKWVNTSSGLSYWLEICWRQHWYSSSVEEQRTSTWYITWQLKNENHLWWLEKVASVLQGFCPQFILQLWLIWHRQCLNRDYNMVRWISAPGTMHFRPRYDTFWPCGLFTLLQFCKHPPQISMKLRWVTSVN